MEINKALTLAKQLKNHFRIFEELDEFMREAVALQNVVKEFETRKAGLQEEVDRLGREKVLASEEADRIREENRDRTEKEKRRLEEGLSQFLERTNGEIFDMEEKKKAIEGELAEMESLHAETRQRMEEETQQAQTKLDTINRAIKSLRTKLE